MRKMILNLFLGCAVMIALSDCTHKSVSSKSTLPPGQQKKLYGVKSAAPFAPGQTKKQTGSAAKTVPPGQSKKLTGNTTGKTAPGQAKKKGDSKSSN